MSEENHQKLAQQLRKPEGPEGLEVAQFMNQGNELLNRNTITALDLKPDSRVVELGMGNGKFVEELLQNSNITTYTGCDYSMDMVNEAKMLNENLMVKKDVKFLHCSANNLPFSEKSVDAIFSVNTLYFWDDYDAVLSEFRRVLKDDGQLVLGIRPDYLMKHYPFVKYGFRTFSANEIKLLLSNNHFKSITTTEISEPDFVSDEITFPVKSLVVSCRKA